MNDQTADSHSEDAEDGSIWSPSDTELSEILSAHRRWLRWKSTTELKPQPELYRRSNWPEITANIKSPIGARADLENADLRGVEVRGANLSQANLRGADLSGASLQETNLSEANLANAALVDADLEEARVSGADFQEADLSGAYLVRAHMSGAFFPRADLSGAELLDASLEGADFEDANLTGADLQGSRLSGDTYFGGADLSNANLKEVSLHEAHLGGAILSRANLRGVDLSKTDLSDVTLLGANLEGSNLKDVSGLRSKHLRGTNVSNAKLPGAILGFDPFGRIEQSSRSARKLFISLLLACGYSVLAVMSVESGDGPVQLPLLSVSVAVEGFFVITPVLLLLMYTYFHVQLQRVWDELAKLPARLEDGNLLDEKIYPWLVTGIVRDHIEDFEEDDPPLFRLQRSMVILIAWGSVPLTLVGMGIIALVQHRWWVGGLNLLLCVSSTLLACYLYEKALKTVDRRHRERALHIGSLRIIGPWPGKSGK